MAVTVGVDLGGSNTRIAVVDEEGIVLEERRIKTPQTEDVAEIIKVTCDQINSSLTKAGLSARDVIGVGVGCAGQISQDGRWVRFAPNLGWRDIPLADAMEERIRRPVMVENDVRVAALGEASFGAGRGVKDLICVFVGTGVGSGILIGGRLLRGWHNLAGEVGHMKLSPEGPKCTCGGSGCLEVYAGGGHVKRRVMEALESEEDSLLRTEREIHTKTVEDAARRGDALAKRLWEEIVWALGMGIANLVTLLNPQKVILGGGVVEASPILIDEVRKGISRWATMLSGREVEVVRAALGDKAGAVGASQLFGPVWGPAEAD
jgi:glucokinase